MRRRGWSDEEIRALINLGLAVVAVILVIALTGAGISLLG